MARVKAFSVVKNPYIKNIESEQLAFRLAVGRVIRSNRKRLGFTQAQFSERTGLSTRNFSFIELGKGNPMLSTLYVIARNLGFEDPGDLLATARQEIISTDLNC